MLCTSKPHLDHSEEALVGGGVGGDGEASRGVPGDDAVHGAPGRSVRLVFVCHGQVGDDHVHPVLVNLPEELKEQRLDDSNSDMQNYGEHYKQTMICCCKQFSEPSALHLKIKSTSPTNTAPSCPACSAEEDKHIGCFIGFSLLHHLPAANKSSESFSVV